MNNAYNVAGAQAEYNMLQQGILTIQMTTLSLQVYSRPNPHPRPKTTPHILFPHPPLPGGRPASRSCQDCMVLYGTTLLKPQGQARVATVGHPVSV